MPTILALRPIRDTTLINAAMQDSDVGEADLGLPELERFEFQEARYSANATRLHEGTRMGVPPANLVPSTTHLEWIGGPLDTGLSSDGIEAATLMGDGDSQEVSFCAGPIR